MSIQQTGGCQQKDGNCQSQLNTLAQLTSSHGKIQGVAKNQAAQSTAFRLQSFHCIMCLGMLGDGLGHPHSN